MMKPESRAGFLVQEDFGHAHKVVPADRGVWILGDLQRLKFDTNKKVYSLYIKLYCSQEQLEEMYSQELKS